MRDTRSGLFSVPGMSKEEMFFQLEQREIARRTTSPKLYPFCDIAMNFAIANAVDFIGKNAKSDDKSPFSAPTKSQVIADGIVIQEGVSAGRICCSHIAAYSGMIRALTSPLEYIGSWNSDAAKWIEIIGRVNRRKIEKEEIEEPSYEFDVEKMSTSYNFVRVMADRARAIVRADDCFYTDNEKPSGWQLLVIYDDLVGIRGERDVVGWTWVGHKLKSGEKLSSHELLTMSEIIETGREDEFEHYTIMNGVFARHENLWGSHT